MKKLILAASLFGSLHAQAEQPKTTHLNCYFTEPFFSLEIDLQKNKITRTEPNWQEGGAETVTVVDYTGIKVQGTSNDPFLPKFNIIADNKVIGTLVMNFKGSDGMSNTISPFDINYTMVTGQNYYGGCSSNLVDSVNFEDAY